MAGVRGPRSGEGRRQSLEMYWRGRGQGVSCRDRGADMAWGQSLELRPVLLGDGLLSTGRQPDSERRRGAGRLEQGACPGQARGGVWPYNPQVPSGVTRHHVESSGHSKRGNPGEHPRLLSVSLLRHTSKN